MGAAPLADRAARVPRARVVLLLRLVELALRPADDRDDGRRLPGRPCDGAHGRRAPSADLPDRRARLQPRAARLLQVRRVLRALRERARRALRRGGAVPGTARAAADRDLLRSHRPVPVHRPSLRHRRRGNPRRAHRPRPGRQVRYIGSSSYSGSQIVEAQWASRERHLERFVTEQPPYSILVRGIEQDVLPPSNGTAWERSPTARSAGGWLSGRWRKDAAGIPTSAARPSARFDMSSPANQRKLDIVEELAQLAEQTGITLIELAIAFVINHPASLPRSSARARSSSWSPTCPPRTSPCGRGAGPHRQARRPRVTVNPDDNSYGDHELTPAARRR